MVLPEIAPSVVVAKIMQPVVPFSAPAGRQVDTCLTECFIPAIEEHSLAYSGKYNRTLY
jgi:hypothetical protein